MRYTVLWIPNAEQQLADVWTNSSRRSAITAAANEIDRTLAQDAETKGEIAFDTVRTLAANPLGVDFEVVVEDRKVYVLSVWDMRFETDMGETI